jgi:hypothetical protein
VVTLIILAVFKTLQEQLRIASLRKILELEFLRLYTGCSERFLAVAATKVVISEAVKLAEFCDAPLQTTERISCKF